MTAFLFRSFAFSTALMSLLFMFWLSATSARAEVTLDGTMGVAGSISGPGYLIPDTVGSRAGANLFHSFGTFNIETGASATFTNSGAPLSNVITRVTGGPSSIDGAIRSTIEGANLFLLNPSGVMFGPNASLDLTGSFHVTTADYLKFSNGEQFSAHLGAASSVLSVAEPAAFGFLATNPAAISGNSAYLQVPSGQTLSVIGGDLTFTGTPATPDEILFFPAVLSAPGGRINLASVASAGELPLADLATSGFASLGHITLSDGAKLNVSNIDENYNPVSAGGTVIIRGGEMIFRDGGIDAYGNPGGIIDVKGDSLHLENYYFFAANFNFNFDPAYAGIDHPGTAVRIDLAGDLVMDRAALIDTQNIGSGRGGDISIKARNVRLGDEVIDANSFTSLGFYGYIGSATFGSGRSGNIAISADDILVRNGFFVNAQTFADGDTGAVSVHVNNALQIMDQGTIGIKAAGSGKGGVVDISATDIVISAEKELAVTETQAVTGIVGQASYDSDGGTINVTADRLRILAGGTISSVLFDEGGGASGKGTDVNIAAGDLTVAGYVEDPRYQPLNYSLSSIDARVYGSGASGTGGNISIATDNLKLENGGAIRTGLYFDATGNAGNITVNAGAIDINTLGQIYADSFRGTGNSGSLNVTAQSMKITGTAGTPSAAPLDFDFTGLSTTTNAGSGGSITVNLTGDLALAARGGIKADTRGSGAGGTIAINADDVALTSMGQISSSSASTGNAGNIEITARDTMQLHDSSITTEALLADGGDILLAMPNKLFLVNSKITASVGGGSQTTGGNITIDPEYVIANDSQIVANAFQGTGGNITIVANVFLVDPRTVVDASSQLGISGTIDIQAPTNNISGIVTPLSSDFVSAAGLLKERCIARIREGKYSSFVVGGRDGLPIEPGRLQPSVLY